MPAGPPKQQQQQLNNDQAAYYQQMMYNFNPNQVPMPQQQQQQQQQFYGTPQQMQQHQFMMQQQQQQEQMLLMMQYQQQQLQQQQMSQMTGDQHLSGQIQDSPEAEIEGAQPIAVNGDYIQQSDDESDTGYIVRPSIPPPLPSNNQPAPPSGQNPGSLAQGNRESNDLTAEARRLAEELYQMGEEGKTSLDFNLDFSKFAPTAIAKSPSSNSQSTPSPAGATQDAAPAQTVGFGNQNQEDLTAPKPRARPTKGSTAAGGIPPVPPNPYQQSNPAGSGSDNDRWVGYAPPGDLAILQSKIAQRSQSPATMHQPPSSNFNKQHEPSPTLSSASMPNSNSQIPHPSQFQRNNSQTSSMSSMQGFPGPQQPGGLNPQQPGFRPPFRMPVPIAPAQLKPPDGRVMRGPTIFGAAIAAGVHPTTRMMSGDGPMEAMSPPAQSRMADADPSQRPPMPIVGSPPQAVNNQSPANALKMQVGLGDFRDFMQRDDDDDEDEGATSPNQGMRGVPLSSQSMADKNMSKPLFKLPFMGAKRKAGQNTNRMSFLGENGKIMTSAPPPPPVTALKTKTPFLRSKSSKEALSAVGNAEVAPTMPNSKVLRNKSSSGSIKLNNSALDPAPNLPTNKLRSKASTSSLGGGAAVMNEAPAMPMNQQQQQPMPQMMLQPSPPQQQQQQTLMSNGLPPMDAMARRDLDHASSALIRVLRRLQGFDNELDIQAERPGQPSMTPKTLVAPSELFLLQFAVESVPHLFVRVIRGVETRLGELNAAGVRSEHPAFGASVQVREVLEEAKRDWDGQVVRALLDTSGAYGPRQEVWKMVERSGVCERVIGVTVDVKRLVL